MSVSGLVKGVKAAANRYGQDPAAEATGVNSKMKNVQDYIDATKSKPVASKNTAPSKPLVTPLDKVNPKSGGYGDRQGEVRIPEADQWAKPLGSQGQQGGNASAATPQFKKGGKVKRVGKIKVHKGERLVAAKKASKLKGLVGGLVK